MNNSDKYDPFATHVPDGMTQEEVEAEEQRLLRQKLEDELRQNAESLREEVRRNSQKG